MVQSSGIAVRSTMAISVRFRACEQNHPVMNIRAFDAVGQELQRLAWVSVATTIVEEGICMYKAGSMLIMLKVQAII